jgi:hypothetical protein
MVTTMTTRISVSNTYDGTGPEQHTLIVQSNTRGTVYVAPGITRNFNMEPDEILVLRANGAKEPTGVPLDVPPETGVSDD